MSLGVHFHTHTRLFQFYSCRVNSLCGMKSGGSCVASAEDKALQVFDSCVSGTTTTATNAGVLVVCWGCNVWHR
jgi:hypothetical protein